MDNRRSHGGYIFSFGSAPVSWYSQKQETVAGSSTEAEYRALYDCITEAIYLRQFLAELHFPCPEPTIYVDNKSAIALASNPIFSNRTKHVGVHFYFSREQVELGTIRLIYVPAADNHADILTKPVNRPTLEHLSPWIGIGVPPP